MAQAIQRGIAFAKTTRPVIGSVVRRESIFARFDRTDGWTVAWISGPAGSGKSTLAASYVEARNLRCIWYQIDPDDSDAATFFHYLGHAARRFEGSRPRELPAFSPQYADDVASFSRRFFRQLFSGTKAPAALVLDNLHEVSAASPLHAAIEAGLAQVPKARRVLITSRSEPQAALARMRVSGGLIHVGWEELRIRPEEIAGIASLRGHSLGPEEAARLYERTQGWAAGLVLMLEHAKVSGRIAELPGDATPQLIFDYLAGEIFDRFEPKIQQFLLGISCLPRMNAEVAEALTGEERAGRLLLNLARNDYFVREVPGEDTRIFQLHPLLRDFLRNRAAQVLPKAVSAAGRKRAAALLRSAGHVEDAVSLLAECRDWDDVARIAAEEADNMLAQGRSETLCGWLELLPPVLIEADPRLLQAHAASRLHASPRTARHLFAQAYDGFHRIEDRHGMTRSCCGMLSAIIAEFDDLTALDHWMHTLARLLTGEGAAASEPDPTAALVRAILLRDPGSAELAGWLDHAERIGRGESDAQAVSGNQDEIGLVRALSTLLRGDAAAAEAIIVTLKSTGEQNLPGAGARGMASALIRLLDGEHAAALCAARETLGSTTSEGDHSYEDGLRIIAAAAALSAGDVASADSELRAIEAPGVPLRRGIRAFLHYLRWWRATLDDDTAGAGREARMALAVAVELGMPWVECLARVACGQTFCSEGDRRGAEAQLRAAQAIADRVRSPYLRVAVRLTMAGVALKDQEAVPAPGALKDGLALGRAHGLRHVMGVCAPLLADVCAAALRRGVEPDFARGLVRAGSLVPPASALHLKQWPRPLQVCTLGGFSLLRESTPVEFSGKGPGRPVELLKVLVALGTQNVRSGQLADALWPGVDADYAHKSFTIALHRLRRMLEDEEALLLRDTRLSLNPRLCWVDTCALEQLIGELDAALRDLRPGAAEPALHGFVDEALALYRGPFLPDESEQPSYIGCRDQIRARVLRCLARVSRAWEAAGMQDAAADCYLRLIDVDPLFEAPYRNLMLCYQRRGDRAEAVSTYERLRTALSARLKVMPSPESQAVYTDLLGNAGTAAAPGG